MKICSVCVLPDTFPGIRFNAAGMCQHCSGTGPSRESNALRERYRSRLQEILDMAAPQGSYDAIMAYSGGKDSSYTLKVLTRDLNLKTLALTFNHGFVSPRAFKNIKAVTQALDVDHLMVSPRQKTLCHAFRKSITANAYPLKALQRASAICNTCMHLVKSYVLKTALEMKIPLIAYGWSPGQAPIQASVMRLNEAMVRQAQGAMTKALQPIMGEDLKPFLLLETHLKLLSGEGMQTPLSSFHNIHPLAFSDYDEQKILEEIRTMGWESPRDTDGNSTNCLLNGFANQVHLDQFGFHPYAFEIAHLVRHGWMSREAGLAKLATPADSKVLKQVGKKLMLE